MSVNTGNYSNYSLVLYHSLAASLPVSASNWQLLWLIFSTLQ